MKGKLAKAVTHRQFLKMCGLAIVGAGAGQVVAAPRTTLAADGNFDNLYVTGFARIQSSSPVRLNLVRSEGGELNLRYVSNGTSHWIGFTDGAGNWMLRSEFSTNNLYVPGNVGIGTSTPFTRTHIVKPYTLSGDPNLTNQYLFGVYQADMTLLLTADNGRVQDKGGSIGFSNNHGFVLGAIKGAAVNSDGNQYGGYLAFYTTGWDSGGPYEKMRITQDGKIGIGTTNPSAKLEVAGEIRVNGVTAIKSDGVAAQSYYA